MRLLAVLAFLTSPAMAQDRLQSNCIALAEAEPNVVPVALNEGLEKDSVLIRYLDHASFAIVTGDGTVAVTDYTGYLGTQDLVRVEHVGVGAVRDVVAVYLEPVRERELPGEKLARANGQRVFEDLRDFRIRPVETAR